MWERDAALRMGNECINDCGRKAEMSMVVLTKLSQMALERDGE